MALRALGVVKIPDAANSEFDHAAFDPKKRRVFIAHAARDRIEVIDHDAKRHIATLPGFPGVAGAVADDGARTRTMTGAGAHTTAIVVPDHPYVISPKHGGVLVLADGENARRIA